MDRIDRKILTTLQAEGRISNVELARRVNLSPTPCLERVRRLEREGYIQGYAARLDPEKLGAGLMILVQVTLDRTTPDVFERFREAITRLPEVLECHHVTGDYDYLLKIVAHNTKDLENFLLKKLTPIPGVARIHTSLVLNEVKSTTVVPINMQIRQTQDDVV